MIHWLRVVVGATVWYGVTRWTEMWNTLPPEPRMVVPGDDLIRDPDLDATRAVVVPADPETTYRWLAQMGPGRAGWYSYDRIDNRGVESARVIHDEWVVDGAGRSMGKMAGLEFVAAEAEPGRHLVIALSDSPALGFTMAYLLVPWGDAATRVVVRVRAAARSRWLGPAIRFVLGPADFVMMRRQLIGLRARVAAV